MRRKEKKSSLKKQFQSIFLIGYLALIILLIILDFNSIFNYNSKIKEANLEGFQQYYKHQNDTIKNVDNIIADISLNNDDFTKLATTEDPVELNNSMFMVKKELANRIRLQRGKIGFLIANSWNKSRRYLFSSEITGDRIEELLKQLMTKINSENPDSGWSLILTNDTYYCVKIYRKKAGAIAGIVELNNKTSDITDYVRGNAKAFLVLNNKVLNNPEEDNIAIKLPVIMENGVDFSIKKYGNAIYYYNLFEGTNIGILVTIQDTIWNYLQVFQIVLLGITLGSIFAVAFLSRYVLRQILRPLQELTGTMNQIRLGEIDAKIESDYKMQEFEEVKDTFHMMMDEIQELKIQSYEEKIHKQKAQLLYYQLQLKPHFYLNCLKTLNALLNEKQYDRTQELIFDISTHMRYLIKSDKALVQIQAELDFVKSYLIVQKNTYSREFSWELQVDQKLLQEQIPPLTIQTFIENSIKYAKLSENRKQLFILVKGTLLKTDEGNYMDLIVRDNGSGYPEEILEVLNERAVEINTVGVGIANLLARCNLIYQGKVEYFFQNDQGAVSELIIPLKEMGEMKL